MPNPENFTVNEVRAHVGGRRMLDVMECVTQRAMEMSMRDFAQYFEVNILYISLGLFKKYRSFYFILAETIVEYSMFHLLESL